ncbi:MAG TPA: glycerophosphodiester phosphodiesterase family protein [Nocardioidaceae bacterium]
MPSTALAGLRGWVLLLLAVVLVLGGQPAVADDSSVAAIAHRGASKKAPENTMSAVTQAIAERSDFAEVDVRLSRDGVPVVVHDRGLARTTNVEALFPARSPWPVAAFSLAELKRLDAGAHRSSTYQGERIPTLTEVLAELAPSPTGILLEVKQPRRYGGLDGIGRAVVDDINQAWTPYVSPTSGRLILQSFDLAFVRELHARHPQLRYALLGSATSVDIDAYPFADDVQVDHRSVTQEYVDQAHGLPTPVLVGAWTVDDPTRMGALVDLGVDSITSNRPDVLRDLLDQRGVAFRPERWPTRSSERPTWQLTAPAEALLGTRLVVRARLTAADGSPGRWQWAALQVYGDGRWRTLQKRATDAEGVFSTTVRSRKRLRLRVASLSGGDFPVARSAARKVVVRRAATRMRLLGPREAERGSRVALDARWRAEDGRRVSGYAVLLSRRADGTWRALREVRIEAGKRRLWVRPRRTTHYALRGLRGPWFLGDADRHRVLVR